MLLPLEQAETLERQLLGKSFLSALLLFILFGAGLSFNGSFRPSSQVKPETQAPLLEVELVPETAPPKLHQAAAPAAPPLKTEATVSTKLSTTKQATQSLERVVDAPNQTTAQSPPPPPTHGPMVNYAPSPKIPSYLKNAAFKTSVWIEFFVPAQGACRPALIGSSGSEELDAIALKFAQNWVFRPAEKDGKVTDSKVRLRINFEVE